MGRKKKTHEEFLDEVKALVGDEYKIVGKYVNTATKVEMEHNVCGHEFDIRPNDFLKGSRCPKCSGVMKKTTEIFKREVFALVGDEYKILGEYVNAVTKVLIKHNVCGCEYNVRPNDFLNIGSRCPKCSGLMKKTTEIFKREVFALVGDEYKILGEYVNNNTKIRVSHDICSYEFDVRPIDFLRGGRCQACSGKMQKTTEIFKREVFRLEGDEYKVLGEYVNNKTKIKMMHNVCGCKYSVIPGNFLRGSRCPKCNDSKGEKKIYEYMINNDINFIKQHRFTDCKNKKLLPFDFAIVNNDDTINCLIEYDGQQHYQSVKHWGGEKGFRQRQRNDQIKNQYCKDNNIKLIRIPYWDFDNIEDILNEELKEVINQSKSESNV